MGLSRQEALKGVASRKAEGVKAVPVPEWGGEVYVRRLGVRATDDAQSLNGQSTDAERTVYALILGVTDETGNPLFLKEDAEALLDAEPAIVQRLVSEFNKVNGYTEEAIEEAAEVFDGAQTGSDSSE